jgi:hypothetical protein
VVLELDEGRRENVTGILKICYENKEENIEQNNCCTVEKGEGGVPLFISLSKLQPARTSP